MLCLARNIPLLVIGRLLQGFSASVVWTVGLALIIDTVGEDEVGEMLGYMSISMTLGFLLGPLLGGIVFERVG
jgi:MFS family permease